MTAYSVSDSNLFAYCGNNPVLRGDAEGEFWNVVIGAAVGGLLSGITTAITSYAETGSINWGSVAISAATGALNGGLAATGVGLMGRTIASGVISAVGDAATQRHENRSINWGQVIGVGVTGAAMTVIGEAPGKLLSASTRTAGETRLTQAIYHRRSVYYTPRTYNAMVSSGKKLINTARGISSVVGTISTYRLSVSLNYIWSKNR